MTGACSCENEHHFDDKWNVPGPHRSTHHHEYGEVFGKSELVEVKTPFGTFEVCKACADNCLKEYPRGIQS